MTSLNDQLRLEILATSSGNVITNHSGQAGNTTGWRQGGYPGTAQSITAVTGKPFGYTGGKALELANTLNDGSFSSIGHPGFRAQVGYESESFSIVGGQWANAAVTMYGNNDGQARSYGVSVKFYDVSDVILKQVDYTLGGVSAAAETTITLDSKLSGSTSQAPVAPSGTHHARVLIVAARSDNAMASATTKHYAYKLMVVAGASKSSVTGPVFSDTAETWQNLLPRSVSHSIIRGGDVDGVTDNLEVGQMTSVLTDPAMTPENNDRIRPGRPIRLVRSSDGASVFKGKIVQAQTSYAGGRPTVTLTATDAMADLANFAQPTGKGGRFKQRVDAAMLNVPVTYAVTDTDSNLTSNVIGVDTSGTALSQLALVRDSLRGLFYVDRSNVLRAFASNSYPSQTATVTLSDSSADVGAVLYLKDGIATNFDSKNLVNTLTVTKTSVLEQDGSKVYGPYVNQDSVDEWGVISADLAVNDGTPATLAGLYLAVYDEPTIFVDEVTFDATASIGQAVSRELYEAARVKYAVAGVDDTFRVIGIEHQITPDQWLVTLRFKPMEASSTITVTNPPGGASSGPEDLSPLGDPRLVAMYRNFNASVANVTNTNVLFDTVITDNGIPWDSTDRVFTVPRAGRYHVSTSILWTAASGGVRRTAIEVNGSERIRSQVAGTSAGDHAVTCDGTLQLSAGDEIGISVIQSSGGTLQVVGERTTYVTIAWVGP